MDGSWVPRATNAQLASLTLAWRRAASRSKVAWPIWRDIADAILGRLNEGDRFDMSTTRQSAQADDDVLLLVWQHTSDLAAKLDDSRAVVRPLTTSSGKAAYEQLARDAWEAIKSDRDKDASSSSETSWIPPIDKLPDIKPPADIIDIIRDPLKPVKRKIRNVAIVAAGLGALAVVLLTKRRKG